MKVLKISDEDKKVFSRRISKESNGVYTAFEKDPKSDISYIVDGIEKGKQALFLLHLCMNHVGFKAELKTHLTALIELLNTKYKPSNIEDYNFTLKAYMKLVGYKIGKISKYIDPTIHFMDAWGEALSGTTHQGDINASGRGIETLLGSPDEVNGNFKINKNKFTSLVGAPKIVNHLDCEGNKIKDLIGCPEVKGFGNFRDCKELVSLEGGNVAGLLDIRGTAFKSKEDIIDNIIRHKMNVQNVETDFGTFNMTAINKARNQQKMGKFKDLLKFK